MAYNWREINREAEKQGWHTQADIIKALGIPQQTVSNAFLRGDLPTLKSGQTYPSGYVINNSGAVEPRLVPVGIDGTIKAKSVEGPALNSVLFVTDPHFGFVKRNGNELVPIHSRSFLMNLLNIIQVYRVDGIVWGGDMLDLADVSRFPSTPDMLDNIQLAIYELAWFLNRVARVVGWQVVIEGNHDARLQKALVKHLPYIGGLRSVVDLHGYAQMSIPSLINADQMVTQWIGDYPNGEFVLGDAIFKHGSLSRSAPGGTVTGSARGRTRNYFYGHCHRMELIRKTIPDTREQIWVGSPGMALNTNVTPGASLGSNWQLGAFLIHYGPDEKVSDVEIISQDDRGVLSFRGKRYFLTESYLDDMLGEAPSFVAKQLSP